MANRCHTEVAIFGGRSELQSLYSALCEFKEKFHSEHPEYKEYGIYERDFAESFGYEAEDEYDSNGWIEHFELEDDCLKVWQGDRYSPRTQFWYHITRRFETLDYVFYAQEPMMCLFECTDEEHKFFDYYKYRVMFDVMDDTYNSIYGCGNTVEELIKDVNEKSGTDFGSVEDIVRYCISVPPDIIYYDGYDDWFICYVNPWREEDEDIFRSAVYKIRHEPGWEDPEPLYPYPYDEDG